MAVDKLVDSTQLDADLTSVANAIRAKSGGSNSLAFPSEFITEIASIPTGGSVQIDALSVTQNGTYTAPSGHAYSPVTVNVGGSAEVVSMSDPVRFFDYDGTLVHSYSASDFQALTAMPSNPSHSGLTAQGWNWTLADAKAQLTAMGTCDIAQCYITSDGKTRVYVHMVYGKLSPYLGLCPNGTVTIDWGDNTATSTLTGTSLTTVKQVQHTYASEGDYVITLTPTSGTFAFYGTANGSHLFRKSTTHSQYISSAHLSQVKKVELGTGATIGNYGFNSCYALETITIPSSITSFGTNAFQTCYSLRFAAIPSGVTSLTAYIMAVCYSMGAVSIPKSVVSIGNNALRQLYTVQRISIPSTVTSMGANVFYTNYALQEVKLPDVTSLGNYTFYTNYSLPTVTIPSTVTSIGTYVFNACYGLAEIHFKPTTPPTVANANAFTNVPTDCKIYVPTGTLSEYTSAENYPSSATYTYIEE